MDRKEISMRHGGGFWPGQPEGMPPLMYQRLSQQNITSHHPQQLAPAPPAPVPEVNYLGTDMLVRPPIGPPATGCGQSFQQPPLRMGGSQPQPQHLNHFQELSQRSQIPSSSATPLPPPPPPQPPHQGWQPPQPYVAQQQPPLSQHTQQMQQSSTAALRQKLASIYAGHSQLSPPTPGGSLWVIPSTSQGALVDKRQMRSPELTQFSVKPNSFQAPPPPPPPPPRPPPPPPPPNAFHPAQFSSTLPTRVQVNSVRRPPQRNVYTSTKQPPVQRHPPDRISDFDRFGDASPTFENSTFHVPPQPPSQAARPKVDPRVWNKGTSSETNSQTRESNESVSNSKRSLNGEVHNRQPKADDSEQSNKRPRLEIIKNGSTNVGKQSNPLDMTEFQYSASALKANPSIESELRTETDRLAALLELNKSASDTRILENITECLSEIEKLNQQPRLRGLFLTEEEKERNKLLQQARNVTSSSQRPVQEPQLPSNEETGQLERVSRSGAESNIISEEEGENIPAKKREMDRDVVSSDGQQDDVDEQRQKDSLARALESISAGEVKEDQANTHLKEKKPVSKVLQEARARLKLAKLQMSLATKKRALKDAKRKTVYAVVPINALLKGGLDSLHIKHLQQSEHREKVVFVQASLADDRDDEADELHSSDMEESSEGSFSTVADRALDPRVEGLRPFHNEKSLQERFMALRATMLTRLKTTGSSQFSITISSDAESGTDNDSSRKGEASVSKAEKAATMASLYKQKDEAIRKRSLAHHKNMVKKKQKMLKEQTMQTEQIDQSISKIDEDMLRLTTQRPILEKEIQILEGRKQVLAQKLGYFLDELMKWRKRIQELKERGSLSPPRPIE